VVRTGAASGELRHANVFRRRTIASASARRPLIHPLIVRITHWINAGAIIIMIMSGLEIHNAYPTCLSGAARDHARWLAWRRDAMAFRRDVGVDDERAHLCNLWLYFRGDSKCKLWPISPREVVADVAAALSGRLSHEDLSVYNSVQSFFIAG